MKRSVFIAIFASILFFGLFLRLYKLGEVPNGFYRDESAIGYNAYSLLLTGKDEYGVRYPLYFKSFGDYKLPLYIYTTVVSEKIFGVTPFAVRLPSAIFGFLTLIAVYLMVSTLAKNKKLALGVMAFFSISPWALFYNRATFEVSICLFFFILGTYFLYRSLKEKISGFFLIGTLCFVLSLYGYNLTRLLAPLLFILVLATYRKFVKNIKKWEIIVTGLVAVILLAPFALTFFNNGGVSSASGTVIFTSAPIKAQLLEFRSYAVATPSLFAKVFLSQSTLLIWQYIKNVAGYLSIDFFFINGEKGGNLAIGNMGYLYLFELPLIIGGVYLSLKEKKEWHVLLIGWGIITILVASLTREIPQATRSYFLLFPFEVFSAIGLFAFWKWIFVQQKWVKIFGVSIAIVFVGYSVVYYFVDYYYRFPVAYSDTWKQQDRNVALFLQKEEPKYKTIVIDQQVDLGYTSLLFFQKYTPAKFLKSVKRSKDDSEGFSTVLSFGKYEYREIDWAKDSINKDILIVAQPNSVPKELTPSKIFYYPEKPVVVAIKQQIYAYPTTQKAYAIITAK